MIENILTFLGIFGTGTFLYLKMIFLFIAIFLLGIFLYTLVTFVIEKINSYDFKKTIKALIKKLDNDITKTILTLVLLFSLSLGYAAILKSLGIKNTYNQIERR